MAGEGQELALQLVRLPQPVVDALQLDGLALERVALLGEIPEQPGVVQRDGRLPLEDGDGIEVLLLPPPIRGQGENGEAQQ